MCKNNVCVPKASLFFLKKIKDKINDKIKDTKISSMKEFPVVVMTEKYPYSYDAGKYGMGWKKFFATRSAERSGY